MRTIITMAVFALAATAAQAKDLTGSVAYRERIALPPTASVEVQLLDISRAGATATVIAEQTILPKGQVPVPFLLRFDDAAIKAGRQYAVQARIVDRDTLLFINTTAHLVNPMRDNKIDVLVEHVN